MTSTKANRSKSDHAVSGTSPVTAEVFESNREMKYKIVPRVNGMYCIKSEAGMNRFKDDSFTSYRLAKITLERFLESTDRNGYAKYPSKVVPDDASKVSSE